MISHKCGKCVFFHPGSKLKNRDPSCRRYPPHASGQILTTGESLGTTTMTVWPVVREDTDACGEFNPEIGTAE